MDRLYQERMARLVLDQLVDSGELRSVASQRALSLRMSYLPPRIRLELPAEDDYLPLLDPNRREQAADGLRDALLRVVDHEEADHWVVVDRDLTLDVALREGAARPRVTPVYEPELEAAGEVGPRLGEPRLRLVAEGRQILFRQRQGLLRLDLGRRAPAAVLLEAPDDERTLAWLYATGAVDEQTPDGTVRHRPRTRIALSRDVTLVLRPPFGRLWKRRVRVDVEVLGLARLGRPDLMLTASHGERRAWDRNREPRLELGPELVLEAGTRDVVHLHNTGEHAVSVRWYDDGPLLVPAHGRVSVQGAHFRGLTTPGGVTWDAELAGGASAPAPRVLTLVGEQASAPAAAPPTASGPALFRFEEVAATVYQDAVILPRVQGDVARVAVKWQGAQEVLATVALDDCPGVKVRHGDEPWRHVVDVMTLPPSRARLEAISVPQVTFAVARHVRTLTADPADRLDLGAWKVALTADGLTLDGDGSEPVVVDGDTYEAGSTRVGYRDVYRLRAGDGIFRIVRASAPPEA